MYPRSLFVTLLVLFTLFFLSQHLKSQSLKRISWGRVLGQDKSWYGSKEALRIAENILVHQKANGGWYKNVDMSKPLTGAEKENLIAEKSKTMGTTRDINVGFIQIEYLAKVYQQTSEASYKNAALAGINYLLDAQYETGGWPQY